MGTVDKSFDSGLHTEQLRGRTQQTFFRQLKKRTSLIPIMRLRLIVVKGRNLMPRIWKVQI